MIDEILDKAFTKLQLVEIGKDGNNVYSESKPFLSQITEAKDQIYKAVMEVIGEDEKSEHIRRFQCPNYGEGCYEWSEQYKSSQTPPYCSTDGKKMKSVEYDEPTAIEFDRNELKAEQRQRANKFFGKEK